MADIFSQQAYQGTFVAGTVETASHFQICAIANINASNQLEATFWVNENGNRVDNNLGDASYVLRDKDGNSVSGVLESGISADVNGYYQIAPVSAALIYDLTHYVLEVSLSVDGFSIESSIGLVVGE